MEDLSPDERMRVYLGGLPERVRAFIQTDAVYKPYENGDIAARRPATESADGYIPCSVSTVCLCLFFFFILKRIVPCAVVTNTSRLLHYTHHYTLRPAATGCVPTAPGGGIPQARDLMVHAASRPGTCATNFNMDASRRPA